MNTLRWMATLAFVCLCPLALSGCATYGNNGSDGGGECTGHSDCPADQRCIEGDCLTDPPACGDTADPAPRPFDCSSAADQATCEAAGGSWACGLGDNCNCLCPTTDAGCPCWKASHCQGRCLGELLDSLQCVDTKVGACSDFTGTPYGCFCMIWGSEDEFIGLCID